MAKSLNLKRGTAIPPSVQILIAGSLLVSTCNQFLFLQATRADVFSGTREIATPQNVRKKRTANADRASDPTAFVFHLALLNGPLFRRSHRQNKQELDRFPVGNTDQGIINREK